MLEKSLLEKMQEAKKAHEVGQVIFYNTGKVDTEEKEFAKRINQTYFNNGTDDIEYVLCKGVEFYADRCDFDTFKMELRLGLVYDPKDVDEENNIKEGSKPVSNFVRFFTGDLSCYQNGELTNEPGKSMYEPSRQGYVNYNKLVSMFDKSGVTYNGPKSFESFKNAILDGKCFDLSITADLTKKKEEPVEMTFEEDKAEDKGKAFVKRIFRR